MASEPNSLDVVRTAVEGLSDKQVRHLVATVVGRLVPTVIDAIVETIAAHAQSPWDDGRGHGSSASQDAVTKVCEVCGRQGTRQYVQTATGWRCSAPVKCGERHRPQREPERPPAVTPSAVAMLRELDQVATPVAEKIVGTARHTTPLNPAITARCRDCPQTWKLTGRQLEITVDVHETKRGHMVEVLEPNELEEAHRGS